MNLFSSLNRGELINKLKSTAYDLIVIGGGITGSGIALDAASRGLKTMLIEKKDFASGTSSKSTKLIHGGLRYLKQFEIALVREVGRERAIVHRLAPQLVKSEKMLLPMIKDGTFGKVATSVGLMVYDVLAGVEKADQRKMLSKEETLEIEPLLDENTLEGGGIYAEYRTDDARLTVEVLKTAVAHGADAINYVEGTDFIYDGAKVIGVKCKDLLTDEEFEVSSKYVVSAAGPWVDTLRKTNRSFKGKKLHLTKGVHIVVPHKRLPVKHSLYFDVPDGRMIFAIPRDKVTYIGTTDTDYSGDINDVRSNVEDVEYLLDAANNTFPTVNLTMADVESSWAGLRPLIEEEGKSASELSRKDEIFVSDTGLISIAGGKLTGYRKMAERILDLLSEKFEEDYKIEVEEGNTDQIVLSGGPFKGSKEVDSYADQLAKSLGKHGIEPYYGQYLVSNYGKQSGLIVDQMSAYKDKVPLVRLGRAELWYTVHHEMVHTAMDFFNRRTGRLYFNLPTIEPLIKPIMKDLKSYFGWKKKRQQQEKAELEESLRLAANFE
ncbi:MAG: glycerol-3-phosphate dehydrogenase/oxidase [Cyclobacteriaceae bacterium]